MAAGDWKEMLYACQVGDMDLLQYYLDKGVNPNYQHPEFLTTPLITSIEHGHEALTKLLLEKGADPKLKAGFSEDSPMKVAKRSKNKAAISLLKPYYKSGLHSFIFWRR